VKAAMIAISKKLNEELKQAPPAGEAKRTPEMKDSLRASLHSILAELEVDDAVMTKTASASQQAVEETVNFMAQAASGKFASTRLYTDKEYIQAVNELPDEELHRLLKEMKPPLPSEILGHELATQLEVALQAQVNDDETLDGSATDELGLALEILDCLLQLGVQPSVADRKALSMAAHSVDDATLAARALELILPTRGAEEAGEAEELGPAGQCMAEAMETGGWERQSAEAYLKGQRALPKRDGNHSVGFLSSRYIDPLQGLAGNGKEMDHLLGLVSSTHAQLAPQDAETEQILADCFSYKVEQVVAESGHKEWKMAVITPSTVLARALRNPTEAKTLRSLVDLNLRKVSDREQRRCLANLGFPPTDKPEQTQSLLRYCAQVMEKVQARKQQGAKRPGAKEDPSIQQSAA